MAIGGFKFLGVLGFRCRGFGHAWVWHAQKRYSLRAADAQLHHDICLLECLFQNDICMSPWPLKIVSEESWTFGNMSGSFLRGGNAATEGVNVLPFDCDYAGKWGVTCVQGA